MNKEKLIITDIADLHSINVEYLTAEYGYRAFKGGRSTRVNSSPNTIRYGKGEFIGSFIFDKNVLRRIVLMPLIPGIKAPNYPSEEYQNTKKEYCVFILRDIYGHETKSDETGAYWEMEGITIGCTVILEGQSKYTGGDIFFNICD